jgi:hypothetical protein
VAYSAASCAHRKATYSARHYRAKDIHIPVPAQLTELRGVDHPRSLAQAGWLVFFDTCIVSSVTGYRRVNITTARTLLSVLRSQLLAKLCRLCLVEASVLSIQYLAVHLLRHKACSHPLPRARKICPEVHHRPCCRALAKGEEIRAAGSHIIVAQSTYVSLRSLPRSMVQLLRC